METSVFKRFSRGSDGIITSARYKRETHMGTEGFVTDFLPGYILPVGSQCFATGKI